MIFISPNIVIDASEVEETFIRASGPGGQHVNKTATAVKLRFDVANSPALPENVRRRLMQLAGNRMTEEGVLVIDARRFRTQEQNRRDARQRLIGLIRQAASPPKPRRRTRPPAAAKRRRLQLKKQRARTKQLRKPPAKDD